MTVAARRAATLVIAAVALCCAHRLPAAERSAPAPSPAGGAAPYAVRLRNAQTAKVNSSILGVELGSSLQAAHEKLDKLTEQPAGDAAGAAHEPQPGRRKMIWQLASTDYAAVYAKTDSKGRITFLVGTLREGKEIPFEKLGDVSKAPLQSDSAIAWDVLRPKRPLFRVLAKGADRKAQSVSIFVVRPEE